MSWLQILSLCLIAFSAGTYFGREYQKTQQKSGDSRGVR